MNVDLKAPVSQYTLVTLSYWAFTLSDGALRMLVVLFFHQLGYSPIEIAGVLVLYELFGVITNLYAGWLATTIGLSVTMQMGLGLQITALVMLMVDSSILNVVYVMAAQALSGIGKDLNKMGAKASIKSLVPADAQGRLYRWIALTFRTTRKSHVRIRTDVYRFRSGYGPWLLPKTPISIMGLKDGVYIFHQIHYILGVC